MLSQFAVYSYVCCVVASLGRYDPAGRQNASSDAVRMAGELNQLDYLLRVLEKLS